MSVPSSEWIFAVTTSDFQAKVIDKSRDVPVIVDFWAPWCGPCRALAPLLEKLVNERKGEVLLAKVNTDEEQTLAMDFRIEGIPAVIAFRGGKAVLDFVGLLPEAQLRQFIERILPTEAEREAKEASGLESKDPAQAEKMYRDALAQDRNQESAIVGLARILISQGKLDEASELLENLGPGSEQAEEVQHLNSEVWLKKASADLPDEATLRARVAKEPKNALARYELGVQLAADAKYQESLELLLTAGESDPKLASTKVREAMVQVFHLVGDRSATANDYRNRLSLLLY